MNKSRQQFEQKIEHSYGEDYLVMNDDGDYVNWTTADLWEFWQASRESLDVDYVHYECPGCGAAYLNDNVRCDCGNEETLNKFEYARLSHEN